MIVHFMPVVFGLLTAAADANSVDAVIQVHADQVTNSISRHMTGACIEDVNHEIYGGIYSQMVFGESFQEPAPDSSTNVSGMWRAVRTGSAAGRYALDIKNPCIGAQSQQIHFESGEGTFGVENQGLNRWGMCFVDGKPYEGRIWLRADSPAEVWVSAESADGAKVYAETRVEVKNNDWQSANFSLTPTRKDTAGRLVVALRKPGEVAVGYVSLQAGEWGRFKGLPVRNDVVEALIAQGLTVLRYGGSMVNAPEYRWKRMLGPRDIRPPYKGTWYPYSTNGWGIVDFLDLCEKAGFLSVPAFNMGETPEDMADFVEYVNGPATSTWGRKRVEGGHAEPYRLKQLELGNEEKVDDQYWEKFRPMAEAIWAKDPNLVIVVGDFMYSKTIEDPFNFTGSPVISSLAAHKKILEFAKAKGKPVWFDVHVGNDQPNEPNLTGTRSFIGALAKLCPGANYKVCVFEENAGNHAVRRALGHAHAINQFERLGDRVPILCAANCLQPYKQNDNGWDQGMVFLTPGQVWGQPPYYITQMISRNYLPNCVAVNCQSPDNALDVTAKTDAGRSALVVQILNTANRPVAARVDIKGFVPSKPAARLWQLSGGLDDVNTPEKPKWIAPIASVITRASDAGPIMFTLPANSFSVLRFE